ncbi:MAG: hypothetical protein ACRDGM_07585 [bacterium]
MDQSSVVVVSVAPGQLTEGLAWELRQIDRQHAWWKVLLVFPPIPDDELRARWQQFATFLADTGMERAMIPVDPAVALAAVFTSQAGWTVFTATRRTEETYREALTEATESLRNRSRS